MLRKYGDDMDETMTPISETCQYSALHQCEGVPATVMLDCGAVGLVPACQVCADTYVRQGQSASSSQDG